MGGRECKARIVSTALCCMLTEARAGTHLQAQEAHEDGSEAAQCPLWVVHVAVVAIRAGAGGGRHGVASAWRHAVVHVVVTPDEAVDVAMGATSAALIATVVAIATRANVAAATARYLHKGRGGRLVVSVSVCGGPSG